MKKCSQSHHHSLTQLNITPLLDLAFVLLVIFIITTTPIVNDLELNLPKGAKHAKDPPRRAHYITVEANGTVWMDKTPRTFAELQPALVGMRIEEPDLSVIVRGDSK